MRPPRYQTFIPAGGMLFLFMYAAWKVTQLASREGLPPAVGG